MKLITSISALVTLFTLAFSLEYDSRDELDEDVYTQDFDLEVLQGLFEDWKSLYLGDEKEFFRMNSKNLFRNKTKSKDIVSRLSGDVYMSNITIYGFEDQQWQYWTAPNATAACDSCSYETNGTDSAERYYGGFSARVRSLSGQLNINVDGADKVCDVVGIVLKRNSDAHQTLANKTRVDDNLNYFRLLFDFAFIWSPPIGLEIKEWKVLDDWPYTSSRFYLERHQDATRWLNRTLNYHSPLFHMYVDPKCLKLSYSKLQYFNRALSARLDYQVSGLIADAMLSHFTIHLGQPYANYRLLLANGSYSESQGVPVDSGAVDESGKPTRKEISESLGVMIGSGRGRPNREGEDTGGREDDDDAEVQGGKFKPVQRPKPGAKPAGGKPAGSRPAGGKPAGSRPAGGKPAAGKPAAGKPKPKPVTRRTTTRPAAGKGKVTKKPRPGSSSGSDSDDSEDEGGEEEIKKKKKKKPLWKKWGKTCLRWTGNACKQVGDAIVEGLVECARDIPSKLCAGGALDDSDEEDDDDDDE